MKKILNDNLLYYIGDRERKNSLYTLYAQGFAQAIRKVVDERTYPSYCDAQVPLCSFEEKIMKRSVLLGVMLLAGVFASETALAGKNLLPGRVASGQTVRCADKNNGKWCDATNNPPPAWDGTPIGGKPVPQQQAGNPCSGLSGNQRIVCEQAGALGPILGILGR